MPAQGSRNRDIKPVSFLWRDQEIGFMPVIGTVFPDGRVECLYGMEDWIEDRNKDGDLPYVFRDPKLMDE